MAMGQQIGRKPARAQSAIRNLNAYGTRSPVASTDALKRTALMSGASGVYQYRSGDCFRTARHSATNRKLFIMRDP